MILVDTSVWIDHFRKSNTHLIELLKNGYVSCHPLIIGELACGNLKQRDKIISLLKTLPKTKIAADDEVLYFIEERQLMSKGIGIVDMHLLTSVILTNILLWTADKRLKVIAKLLNICFEMPNNKKTNL